MRFSSTFNEEFLQAVDYYRQIDPALARDFVDAIDAATNRVERFPAAGAPRKNYRFCILKRFPYSFCYKEDWEGEVTAVALVHHKQKGPGA